MQPKSLVIVLTSMLALCSSSFGEACLYGLYASTVDACRATQDIALQRVASAKTICYSANSRVEWSKNNKEPVGAFASMRNGARVAMKGFTALYACERADLVIKITYDSTSDSIDLSVTDAESGDLVFKEYRTVSDLSSDLTRMAMHFQSMRSDALAVQAAAVTEAQAQAKREAFFANLPKRWHSGRSCDEKEPCSKGSVVAVSVSGGVLYETSSDKPEGEDSIKHEIACTVKQGADEVTPWTGYCTHNFSWPNWSRPTCTVQIQEILTTISAKEIAGKSQTVDYSPLHKTPPSCPVPGTGNQDFSLVPEKEQASK